MVLTLDDVKRIRKVIEKRISFRGIKDEVLLDLILSAIYYHPYGYDPFPTVYLKCAYLFQSICTEHPFYDGNKRTSLIVARIFMRQNGYYLVIPLSAVRYSILVAQKKRNFEQITKWIKKHSARPCKSYINKRDRFLIMPVKRIIDLLETDREQEGYRLLDYWLATDIYPENKLDAKDVLDFLFHIANSRQDII
jgi:death on curing protein